MKWYLKIFTRSRPGLLSTFWVPAAQIWLPLYSRKGFQEIITIKTTTPCTTIIITTANSNIIFYLHINVSSLGFPPVAANRLWCEGHPVTGFESTLEKHCCESESGKKEMPRSLELSWVFQRPADRFNHDAKARDISWGSLLVEIISWPPTQLRGDVGGPSES